MEFFELIKSRRSIRSFDAQKVSSDLIKKIIESGAYAPSACNIQGWRFVVVDKSEIKEKIVHMGGSIIIKSAPVAIFVFYDKNTTNTEYADYIQSAAACLQNMLLAAEDLGLGACWVAHLPRKAQLQKLFNAPNNFEPIACIILGHKNTQEITTIPRKYTLEKIIGFNTFNQEGAIEKSTNPRLIRLARKIYYFLPTGLKKPLNNFIDKKFVKKFKN